MRKSVRHIENTNISAQERHIYFQVWAAACGSLYSKPYSSSSGESLSLLPCPTWKKFVPSLVFVVSCSVVSDSLRPHGLQPASLLCPWNSPGKNTGVGCHSLLQGIFLTQGSCYKIRVLFSDIRQLRKLVNVVLHYGYRMEVSYNKSRLHYTKKCTRNMDLYKSGS